MSSEKPPLSFHISTTIDDIQEQDWNRLFNKNTIEGYGYQRTLEQANLKEFSIGYILAKRDDKLTGIIPFFIMDFSFASLFPDLINKLLFIFRPFLKMKIMFIGAPTAEELYLGIDENENLADFFNRVFEELRKLSKKQKINTVVFNNIPADNTPLIEYFKRKNYIKMESLPTTSINIDADSLESYINKLSENTRKDIKRKLKKSSQVCRLHTEIRDSVDNATCSRIYELYLNNFAESGIHFEKLTCEFFQNICRNMQGIAKFFITFNQDKIVAFNLCLVGNGLCIDKFIGFDREVSHAYSLYFTTFCHNIDWCIKNRINTYLLGTTDYYPKMRLGAKLIPLYVYAKSFNPLINLIVGLIAPLIGPKNLDTSWEKYLNQKKHSQK